MIILFLSRNRLYTIPINTYILLTWRQESRHIFTVLVTPNRQLQIALLGLIFMPYILGNEYEEDLLLLKQV